MSAPEAKMNRRAFLNKSATVIAGGAAFSSAALSYDRILGANDRLSLAHIGIGSRGTELDAISAQLQHSHKCEMTAVCDLWSVNREAARAVNEKFYGRSPRVFQHLEDLLALKDVDAVLISTPEHSQSKFFQPCSTATIEHSNFARSGCSSKRCYEVALSDGLIPRAVMNEAFHV